MKDVFICDSVRTAIGKYGGTLSTVRPDDLATIPIKELMKRNPKVDWAAVDDVMLGCANQAGEDNRNVARMALLLAGMPSAVPGTTINRLCASGLNSVGVAAQAIRAGDAELVIAGGVESMSRAPLVMPKADKAFSRNSEIYDTTIGWRFVNPLMHNLYGTDSMPETAENVAQEFSITREEQDRFAYLSQEKTAAAQADGRLAEEIVAVEIVPEKGAPFLFEKDEHPRFTPMDKLSQLLPIVKDGSVTAANSSGVNDGAAAMIMAGNVALKRYSLEPKARVLGMASAGVLPRIMGTGPVSATKKLLSRIGKSLDDFDIIELNEAFASQALYCTQQFQLQVDDPRLNPLGGAIALGHPLGMTGARLVLTAVRQLHRTGGKLALCTMCVGVGQGVALAVERV